MRFSVQPQFYINFNSISRTSRVDTHKRRENVGDISTGCGFKSDRRRQQYSLRKPATLQFTFPKHHFILRAHRLSYFIRATSLSFASTSSRPSFRSVSGFGTPFPFQPTASKYSSLDSSNFFLSNVFPL